MLNYIELSVKLCHGILSHFSDFFQIEENLKIIILQRRKTATEKYKAENKQGWFRLAKITTDDDGQTVVHDVASLKIMKGLYTTT